VLFSLATSHSLPNIQFSWKLLAIKTAVLLNAEEMYFLAINCCFYAKNG
jgi:hypothetical protein